MATSIIKGSDFKLNLNIDKIDEKTMHDYDFTVELHTSNPKPYIFTKEQLLNNIDKGGVNVILPIVSSKLGTGKLTVRVRIILEDSDFTAVNGGGENTGTRTEIIVINTGIEIKE